VVSHL